MTIKINQKEIQVSQSWNELKDDQLLFIYGVLMTDCRKIFEAQELLPAKKIIIVQKLLGLNNKFMQDWALDCRNVEGDVDGKTVFYSELDEVIKVCDFLFEKLEKTKEDEPDRYQINLSLTRCPIQELSFEKKNKKKKYWYAPADALENISLYELGVSFTLFEKFMKTKDERFAHELIASIYRPSKPKTRANKQSGYEGDRRLPLLKHEAMVKKRMERVKQLPDNIKEIIIFWFACCRHQIIKQWPVLFDHGEADPWTEQTSGNVYGWGGVIIGLAQTITNVDQVSAQHYIDAFTYLSYLEDQRKQEVLRRGLKK